MWKAVKTAPLPIVLLVVSLACPTEFSLFLGGMRLPPHRVALIVLLSRRWSACRAPSRSS